MKNHLPVGTNILEQLFVTYVCFNQNCPGKIVLSLYSLSRHIRAQCPVCKRECTLEIEVERDFLMSFEIHFWNLTNELGYLRLLPLTFSTNSPETVFLDSKQP